MPTDPPPTAAVWQRWRAELATLLQGLDRRALILVVAAAALIVLFRVHGTAGAYNRHFGQLFAGHAWRAVLPNLYWFGNSLLALLAAPLLIARLAAGLGPRDLGLTLGDWRLGLRVAVVLYLGMLPLLVGVSFMPSFVHMYPLSPYVASQAVALLHDGSGLWWVVLAHELGYVAYFVSWELFFRGFLTLGLARFIGPTALLVQLLPFVVLHIGKPEAEALGSIVAGLALGVLALRTRSVLWGWLLHAAVALTMDALAIAARLRGLA